jgi:hypothetical protein
MLCMRLMVPIAVHCDYTPNGVDVTLKYHMKFQMHVQAALKALQAAKITSPLVRQCQQALNGISAGHAMGLNWVPGRA